VQRSSPRNPRRFPLYKATIPTPPGRRISGRFLGHIPVPDRFAAAIGRANRQLCRFVDVDGETIATSGFTRDAFAYAAGLQNTIPTRRCP
jgi:hypothetical protein